MNTGNYENCYLNLVKEETQSYHIKIACYIVNYLYNRNSIVLFIATFSSSRRCIGRRVDIQ